MFCDGKGKRILRGVPKTQDRTVTVKITGVDIALSSWLEYFQSATVFTFAI